jgi:very-short-patch-repair endonuclease
VKRSPPPSMYVQMVIAMLKQERLPAPILEHEFHPTRKWRFDFCWPDHWLAVEMHGAVHRRGYHTRGVGFEQDREKMNEAVLRGWRVLEYSTGQIQRGNLLLDLKAYFTITTRGKTCARGEALRSA